MYLAASNTKCTTEAETNGGGSSYIKSGSRSYWPYFKSNLDFDIGTGHDWTFYIVNGDCFCDSQLSKY